MSKPYPLVRALLQSTSPRALLVCFALAAFSCDRVASRSDYDEKFVKETIKPEMSRQEVLSHFGNPSIETKTSDSDTILIYRKPTKSFRQEDLLNDKGGFAGFEVYFVDDKVIGWNPVTSGPTRSR